MKSKCPKDSLIEKFLPASYYDIITCKVKAEFLTADDIQVAFWTKSPGWVSKLMNLRNKIVRLVGLKDGGKDLKAFEECIRTGGRYDMVSIPAKSKKETILRLDDSHLIADLSIHIQDLENDEKLVSATTLVHFRNKLGYIYFYAICPFHYLVVKQMLKRAVKIAMG